MMSIAASGISLSKQAVNSIPKPFYMEMYVNISLISIFYFFKVYPTHYYAFAASIQAHN